MFIASDKNPEKCKETRTPDDALIELWIRRQNEWLATGAPTPVPLIPADVQEAIIRRAHRLRSESFICLFTWWGRAIKQIFLKAISALARGSGRPHGKF